jgi:hypothetical protein
VYGRVCPPKPLITPALFSHPSTHPTGEKRERSAEESLEKPLSPRSGGWRAGREGLGE